MEHVRLLVFSPKRFLLVIDELTDHAGEPHHFCQRFHAAPDLTVSEQDRGVTISAEEGSMPSLHALTLTDATRSAVVRGQRQPELLGWISCNSASFTHLHVRFRTGLRTCRSLRDSILVEFGPPDGHRRTQ
jgi:hypothetical protein